LRRKTLYTGILFFFLFSGLAPTPKDSLSLEKSLLPKELETIYPLTDDGEKNSLQEAVEKSFAYLEKKKSFPPSRENFSRNRQELLSTEKIRYSLALFREILLNTSNPEEFSRRIQEKFHLLEVTGKEPKQNILLTGYYEPIIAASLEAGVEYQHPIYRRPDDLVEVKSGEQNVAGRIGRIDQGQVIPYYSREEIDCRGVLKGKGYELAWLKDPWERFLLHVQGSGQIRLADGKMLRVGFSISNGRPYRSIGRYLVQQGFFTEQELSLRRVKEFLQKHPEKREEIFNVNERYVFFRPLPYSNRTQEGPIGALDFPLVAGRSVATDHSFFPPGALAFLIAKEPVFDDQGNVIGRKNIRRFVLNQDTGAAMKGPARVDLFCGSGEKAGWVAGEMQEEGKIYLLIAK
jgi:membrane-bound lytic murein transglycosylase A